MAPFLRDPVLLGGMEPSIVSRIPLAAGDRPRLERLLAQCPVVVPGYLELRRALGNGRLEPALRVRITLLVAETYGCEYLLSEAVETAGRLGLSAGTIADARQGRVEDWRTYAVLRFAEGLMYGHGRITDEDLQRLQAAGFRENDIVEIIANVAFGMFEALFAVAGAIAPESGRVAPFFADE
jgi:alkylhydroperoxidase family enzyme